MAQMAAAQGQSALFVWVVVVWILLELLRALVQTEAAGDCHAHSYLGPTNSGLAAQMVLLAGQGSSTAGAVMPALLAGLQAALIKQQQVHGIAAQPCV